MCRPPARTQDAYEHLSSMLYCTACMTSRLRPPLKLQSDSISLTIPFLTSLLPAHTNLLNDYMNRRGQVKLTLESPDDVDAASLTAIHLRINNHYLKIKILPYYSISNISASITILNSNKNLKQYLTYYCSYYNCFAKTRNTITTSPGLIIPTDSHDSRPTSTWSNAATTYRNILPRLLSFLLPSPDLNLANIQEASLNRPPFQNSKKTKCRDQASQCHRRSLFTISKTSTVVTNS